VQRKFKVVAISLAFVAGLVRPSTPVSAQDERPATFELASDEVLLDEVVPIVVTGLAPRSTVTIRARGGGGPGVSWTSSAAFVADENGRVDLTQMAPAKGSYKGVDPMGLFWSAERENAAHAPGADEESGDSSPASWTLTAEVSDRVLARTTVRRLAMARGVRVTRVRDAGFVGMYYEPPDEGRHAAFIVLGGSGGGLPPPAGIPGGLASRGYAVLSLAYFGVPGLPRSLSNIPIEYFGKAIEWLAAQPAVDARRIGVVGSSRGAELALLLGVVYPAIRTVVGYMPSNVVWRGCCDPTTDVAWTLGGRPLAAMPGRGARQVVSGDPEIPVEKIQGAVLLISGRDDGVWPSSDMADKIVSRLRRYGFAHPYASLAYDHTGHGITRPYTSTMQINAQRHPLTGRIIHSGGTPAGTARAREDSWRQLITFVNQHLRDGK
jgi:dienelactone hydrolase